jgi:hypothetical protein
MTDPCNVFALEKLEALEKINLLIPQYTFLMTTAKPATCWLSHRKKQTELN